MGAKGLPEGVEAGPDTTLFPTVDTEAEIGYEHKVRLRMPVFTGALGSTEVARRNWDHIAVGAAISGVILVCGENVCGMDPQAELDSNNKVKESPEMRRRVEIYRRWYEGYGDLFVQMNVEDTRFGVAEYVIEKLGVETIELKWGQGAKRVTLKTGAYPMRELAMALKWSSDAHIDLVTIDGAGGGTGMSPWRMMVEWGIPTFYLEAMTYELCQRLAARGAYVPAIAIAGGLSTEDHIFKVLAMGAPFVKAVCMGRALLIPAMVGKNIGIWLYG